MGKSTRFAIERNQTLPRRGTISDVQSKSLVEPPSHGDSTAPDDGLTQSERFVKAARELGTDDDPERFKERVRKVAKAPPAPSAKAKSGPRSE